MQSTDLSATRIRQAYAQLDPVFRDTPQFIDDQLCAALGRSVLVKDETSNPLRSFKGRGADFRLRSVEHGQRVVCASAGNFGQAIAYVARRRGIGVEVFAATTANSAKVERMQSFGAKVVLTGEDVNAAKDAARAHAAGRPEYVFVEDGNDVAIAEGAGTIGVELLRAGPLDTVVLPVGDGALITGVACWLKEHAPATHVVGVCASGAPSLANSWRAGEPVPTPGVDTIADGIAIRVPVPEAVPRLRALVDDMVLVDDQSLTAMMRLAALTLGKLLEPAAAAGLAAIGQHDLPGERLATVLTGSNVDIELIRAVLADPEAAHSPISSAEHSAGPG